MSDGPEVGITYSCDFGMVIGQVTDGARGLEGVEVKLFNVGDRNVVPTRTDGEGFYQFVKLPAGSFEVRFERRIDRFGKSLELPDGQKKPVALKKGELKLLGAVSYLPEPHIIERQVLINDRPADGILVDVRCPGEPSAIQAQRTGKDGLVTFVMDEAGTYEVRVYPDPEAFGDPLVDVVEVHSTVRGTTNIPSRPAAAVAAQAARAAAPAASQADEVVTPDEVVAFPVLTEEVGYPPSPLARPSGMPAAMPGAAALGRTAMKAISDVLGWQVKSAQGKPDTKGFLGALNASFALKEIGGHTEATWTPRTYAVQTDLSGGITGAQASVYARAKEALDQSLPLLDGLYPLLKDAKDEDIAALRATVRSQFTDLVYELGLLGGPRISRVTQLFFLLLGQTFSQDPKNPNTPKVETDPDKLSRSGSLGNLRDEFGFRLSDDLVNTVADEQNVTNFRIVSDYLTSLAQSWLNNLQFFGLKTDTPFFATQLVLLSRQLSVVAESVNEVRFTLDSVFIGPAERQTLQIDFGKDVSGNPIPPMFLEDLLSWIDSFASEEGPRLIQDGGKFAVQQSFAPIATQLQQLVQKLPTPPLQPNIPPGFGTTRVQNSRNDLASVLQQLVDLASKIQHVIRPEPEPTLAVLAVSPSTIPSQELEGSIVIVTGTGFDSDAAVKFTPTKGALIPLIRVVLSESKIRVTFQVVSEPPRGSYDVTVTNHRVSDESEILVGGFTIT
jgi:hypothetical protein